MCIYMLILNPPALRAWGVAVRTACVHCTQYLNWRIGLVLSAVFLLMPNIAVGQEPGSSLTDERQVELSGVTAEDEANVNAASGRQATGAAPVSSPDLDPPAQNERSYALELGVVYAVTPIAAFAVGGATQSPFSLLAFLAPPLIHIGFNRYGHALLSTLMIPAATFGGAWAGSVINSQNCHNGEGFCDLVGIFLGGIAGYSAWAIIDTALFSTAISKAPLSESTLVLNLMPLIQENAIGGVAIGTFNL